MLHDEPSTALPAQFQRATNNDIGAEFGAAAPTSSRDLAAELAAQLVRLDLFERLAAIRARIGGPVVFTTSFGLEDQAITHALFSQKLKVDLATLDTGRLFPETYEVWAATERRYGARIAAFTPDRAGVDDGRVIRAASPHP